MICRTPEFIPHYYNLDLPLSANGRDIKRAYRRLNLILHPDKIKDPDQRANAFAAILLINEAYETLSDDEKRVDYQMEWDRGRFSTNKWQVAYWDKMRQKKHFKSLNLKPWFWYYDPIPIEICNGDAEDIDFCTATWVNLAHILADNLLPSIISDNIWRRALIWRGDALNMTENKLEILDFQRGCENFQIGITMKEPNLRWSETWSNTNWKTLGEPCEVFCPDIKYLSLGIAILILIVILYLSFLLCVTILRWFMMPSRFNFWPESAINPRWGVPLPDDIITQSRREPPARSFERESSTNSIDEGCYADKEITTRNTPDTVPQPQFYSAVATVGPSTKPSVGTRSKSTGSSDIVRGQDSSAHTLEKSSPTQYYSVDSQGRHSAMHPSQLLSLRSSERHWYYSDPDRESTEDLPLRERRKPSAPPEQLRPRFVHYEDEGYADDERTPRFCMADTATGKPCQRRVSMTSPLTGSTISGLVSPLCFQHRKLRTWIRKNKYQEPLVPGRTPSGGNSPVLEKQKLSRRRPSAK
ncbi:hypothetical protein EYC80_003187 [Monilinia laxa]|uniref:J domain-containing protein n=1 Tax=Monilinia laxa TaxID=61186 RepID=A0A5N6KD23_MONLA|nr:hypothetical protein EYC80_003187 [Monilinia laxa]